MSLNRAYAAQSYASDNQDFGDTVTNYNSTQDELGPGEADFCSRDGASTLKAKIEAYWRERGHNVMISLQNVGFHPAIRAARYDVRSDMVNGLPRAGRKAEA